MISTPLLSLAVAFCLALLATAHLPALPNVFYAFVWVAPYVGPMVGLCALLVVCAKASRKRLHCLAFAGGLALGFVHLGLISAHHLERQVKLGCDGVAVTGVFTVESVKYLPNRQHGVTLVYLEDADSTNPCLADGARLQAHVKSEAGWQPGQKIAAIVKLKVAWGKLQLHGFDVERWWFANGLHGMAKVIDWQIVEDSHWLNLERLRFAIGSGIQTTLIEHPQLGLVLALVIGDQGLIDADTRLFYSETGLAHLVAISGLHITMLAVVFGVVFSRLWRFSATLCTLAPAGKVAPVAGILFALFYAMIAGWGIPAQRTLIMLTVWYWSKWGGSTTSPWNVWLLALILVLLLSPWAILDAGLLLSFGAVGLLIWSTNDTVWVTPSRWQPLRLAIWTQYVCTVGLIPITATLFQFQSWISPLTNAFAIVWMSFVSTPLAIMGALTAQGWLLRLAADSLALQADFLGPLAQTLGSGMAIPTWPWWVLAASVVAGLWLTKPGAKKLYVPIIMLGLCLTWQPSKLGEGEVGLTFHDVGQGTAVTIRTRHHTLVYDTGAAFSESSNSARRIIEPFLRHAGVSRIDQLWLSHNDSDHTGGAAYLLNRFSVDKLVTSFDTMNLPSANNVPTSVSRIDCHHLDGWVWDGVIFTPLPLPSTMGLSDNDKSCVLKITTKNGDSILLTGDIEAKAENLLVETHGPKLHATWLLMPHHGSKTSSTSAFLAAVSPKFALVQAGFNNAYRHPNPQILQRYEEIGITVFNTSHHGAIQIHLFGGGTHHHIELARDSRAGFWRLHDKGAITRE